MEMLCREIESSTRIQLKTRARWLINKTRLKKRLEAENERRSAIVITVRDNAVASLLCPKGLRFGKTLKIVEKYWEVGPGSVCISCASVKHDRLEDYGKKTMQCVICAGSHKIENHKCGVTECSTKGGKICTNITHKCANCGGNHQATALRCLARLKAQAEALKKKGKKSKTKDKQQVTDWAFEDETAVGHQ